MEPLAALIYVLIAQSPPAYKIEVPVPDDPHFPQICRSYEREIDVHSLPLLESRSIRIDERGVVRDVRLDGQRVIVSEQNRPGFSVQDVGEEISPGAALDVVLNFALLDGKAVVYWRESYVHRTGRFGLLSVDGSRLSQICHGSGGVDASH